MPKVSVIVPCYNYGHFLSEAIDSVLKQTYQDYEIIIVDDCSDDGKTPAEVKRQAKKDKRIKPVFLSENKGVAAVRNVAIAEAKGEYITGLDADDKLEPSYLEKTIAKMESTNADVIYTHFKLFGKRNKNSYYPKDQKKIKRALLFRSCFPMWALHKKSDWEAFGGYDESLRGGEIADYWLNFVEANKNFVLVDEILYFYRMHEDSLSKKSDELKTEIQQRIKQNHPNLYKGFDYYCNLNYFNYVLKPTLFQLRTRKGRRVFRLLGITFYKD